MPRPIRITVHREGAELDRYVAFDLVGWQRARREIMRAVGRAVEQVLAESQPSVPAQEAALDEEGASTPRRSTRAAAG